MKRALALSYLSRKNDSAMGYLKKAPREVSRCLECGDKISYGRTDKKFCSDECKNRHHNHRCRSGRFVRRKTMSVLEKNYEILDGLVKVGVDTVLLSDILILGFNPAYLTSISRGKHHDIYACFDITYIMTPSKLCSISKMQIRSVFSAHTKR